MNLFDPLKPLTPPLPFYVNLPIRRTVDRVVSADNPLELKITKLYALAMLDYRGDDGDYAWSEMRRIAGDGQTSAIAFLTGFAATGGAARQDQLIELVKEVVS